MPSQIYEILSLMMRYWFAALGVLIVLRAFWWLWKDHRSREKKRRSLFPHSMRKHCIIKQKRSSTAGRPAGGMRWTRFGKKRRKP